MAHRRGWSGLGVFAEPHRPQGGTAAEQELSRRATEGPERRLNPGKTTGLNECAEDVGLYAIAEEGRMPDS